MRRITSTIKICSTLTICFLLASCAVPDKNPVPEKSVEQTEKQWEPTLFEFAYLPSPIYASGPRLEWDGTCLVERIPHAPSGAGYRGKEVWETRRYYPSKSQWMAFWAEAERLKLRQWRKYYSSVDLGMEVFDASAWSFRARIGSTVIETYGYNAGPALPDVTKTSIASDAILPLAEAIQKLKVAEH